MDTPKSFVKERHQPYHIYPVYAMVNKGSAILRNFKATSHYLVFYFIHIIHDINSYNYNLRLDQIYQEVRQNNLSNNIFVA